MNQNRILNAHWGYWSALAFTGLLTIVVVTL